jgi:tRNA-2-methylthio-N6-dimethylallyladenosine synthase
MAQRLGDELLSKRVRIVAGPDSYRRLPELIRRAAQDCVVDTVFDDAELYEDIAPIRSSRFSAWVAVMRGCNNFCSYCIVPYTRGRERSIPLGLIVDEVESLADAGYREVTLLGQNVNSYRDGGTGFAVLLERVADTGIDWIRFMTSHPKDLSDDILHVMAERKNVCNHLHLPLQSGSDTILAAMNRKYTAEDYLKLVERARSIIGDVSITTDLIFGFPGEKEEDFHATLAVMKEVRYEFAFLYRYSERAGTAACRLEDSVPEETRLARLGEAIALQNDITLEKHGEYIGRAVTVMVKSPSKDGRGWFGFSEYGIPVIFESADEKIGEGSIVTVQIESTTGASIMGRQAVTEPAAG